MRVLLLMLYDPNKLDALLDAWAHVGIQEIGVIEAESVLRRQPRRCRARYPFGILRAVGDVEEMALTVLGLVSHDVTPDACVEATERALGDLEGSDVGLLLGWDLDLVKGHPLGTCGDSGS